MRRRQIIAARTLEEELEKTQKEFVPIKAEVKEKLEEPLCAQCKKALKPTIRKKRA